MHRTEELELTRCADCGAEIDPARERGFGLPTGALCADCARRRGGRFDEALDRWEVEPDLSGLGPEFE